jgi:hypothetical protein
MAREKQPKHREDAEPGPLFCARCAALLQPGSGELFEVRIEARADPYPPKLGGSVNAEATRREIRKLLNQLEKTSAREALEQVYRRMVIHFCVVCYQRWIENPAGQKQAE